MKIWLYVSYCHVIYHWFVRNFVTINAIRLASYTRNITKSVHQASCKLTILLCQARSKLMISQTLLQAWQSKIVSLMEAAVTIQVYTCPTWLKLGAEKLIHAWVISRYWILRTQLLIFPLSGKPPPENDLYFRRACLKC